MHIGTPCAFYGHCGANFYFLLLIYLLKIIQEELAAENLDFLVAHKSAIYEDKFLEPLLLLVPSRI